MRLGLIGGLVLWVLIISTLSGCAGSTGWRFEIGISPVKELNNQAGLKQQEAKNGKY